MKITENNYEEYFLLYIDDELTDLERNAVEAFIKQYPSYATLLDSLQQAKLSTGESIEFTCKNTLYKTEDSEIGIDNYEEYFLLYTDNELSEKDKAATERFVLQHPQLQTEFTLLQQTKLPLETVEFAGKEKLYKKEKERRMIPLYFSKIAMAAAVVTLVVLGWQLSSHKQNSDAATVAKSAQLKQQNIAPATKAELPNETVKNIEQQATLQPTNAKQETKASLENIDKQKQFAATANDINKREKTPDISVEQPDQRDVPTTPEATEVAMQKQPAAETVKQAEILKPLDTDADEMNAQTASSLLSNNNMVQPAVYKELNTDEDNHTLYVGAFQLNKTKVNGFLKSASRLLGSRTKGTTE